LIFEVLHGDPEKIFQFLNKDKKNKDDQIVLVLLQEIGKPIISSSQTYIQIKEATNYIFKNQSMS
jgi:3-dehydroquinate synthetase